MLFRSLQPIDYMLFLHCYCCCCLLPIILFGGEEEDGSDFSPYLHLQYSKESLMKRLRVCVYVLVVFVWILRQKCFCMIDMASVSAALLRHERLRFSEKSRSGFQWVLGCFLATWFVVSNYPERERERKQVEVMFALPNCSCCCSAAARELDASTTTLFSWSSHSSLILKF